MGIHVPLAQPRPVVPVRPLPLLVPAPVGRAVPVDPLGQDVPLRLVVRVLLRLVVLRHLLGGSRRRNVRVHPEGRADPVSLVGLADPLSQEAHPGLDPVALAGLVDVPAAQVGPVVLAVAALVALAVVQAALVDLVVPAVGSRPASPVRTSRPHRRPPRQRPPQRRGDAAAP